MKKKISDLSKMERIATLDALYTATSSIHDRATMKSFLRDLLTESERIMLGRRILIARLLLQGETYDDIVRRVGASPSTIHRVDRWLKDQIPGYEVVLREMEKELKKREDRKKYATNALYRLKKKYPLHFLLFPEPK